MGWHGSGGVHGFRGARACGFMQTYKSPRNRHGCRFSSRGGKKVPPVAIRVEENAGSWRFVEQKCLLWRLFPDVIATGAPFLPLVERNPLPWRPEAVPMERNPLPWRPEAVPVEQNPLPWRPEAVPVERNPLPWRLGWKRTQGRGDSWKETPTRGDMWHRSK